MPMVPPLWVVKKDLGISLGNGLPHVLGHAVNLRQILIFCGCFRRLGIVELFMSGLPEGLFENLSRSARAFLFYLEPLPDSAKVTSKAEPFFDAVASNDIAAARGIAERSRQSWNEGEEYEDDFLYVHILMERFALGKEPAQLMGALRRYEEVLGSGDDPRLELCRALLSGEQPLFDAMLDMLIGDRMRSMQKKADEGLLSPNDSATVAHLWVELLAILKFAEKAGLKTSTEYPFAPSVARRVDRARPPSEGDWKNIGSFHELR